MHTAYLIAAHHQPAHLARLVHALDSPEAAFFIHIDAKSKHSDFRVRIGAKRNVTFVRKRVRVFHSGFSQVGASLALLDEAWNSGVDFQRFCLLSGSDFPIKRNDAILEALSSRAEFLSVERKLGPESSDHHSRYIRYRWFVDRWRPLHRVLYGCLPRGAPPPIDVYHGSSWWALSRDCVAYIRNFLKERGDIVSYFRFTNCPDEMFFQSIVMRSPYASLVSNLAEGVRGCHYVDWDTHGGKRPKVLEEEDFPALCASPALFARKFDEIRSGELLFQIEERLLRPDLGRAVA